VINLKFNKKVFLVHLFSFSYFYSPFNFYNFKFDLKFYFLNILFHEFEREERKSLEKIK
jgi:hypothetical protein